MAMFEITLSDGEVEALSGADTYQQEGPMTTFFRSGDGRAVVDVWSTRVASFRTADLVVIRRTEHPEHQEHQRISPVTSIPA
ncbi:MAG TPA: hypothetical protein VMW08_15890 [Acidimicrobiales bacterium]|nr:hypothetical protein [Acidimicrobiales bacterium]